MKHVTHLILYSLFLWGACQNSDQSRQGETPELTNEELTRISQLIDPAPTTYQEGQINDLIEYALDHNWPVEKTESGLLYWILDPGNEKKASPGSTIQVRYKGILLDGTVFDQSPVNGNPVTFRLDEMIPAWKEALPMIGENGRMKILAHSDLGYKSQQIANVIPAYSPLIFDIELININME